MKRTLVWRFLAAVALAAVLAGGLWQSASADRGGHNPGRGHMPAVMQGEITAIEAEGEDSLLTLTNARGDDAQVLVTDETLIVPKGETPDVGDVARAVIDKSADPDETPVARVLNLARGARPPMAPPSPMLRACGEIAALPDDIHDGIWTISVPDVDDYDLTVTPETKITPPDVEPEEGDRACFVARATDGVWQAIAIQLERPRAPQGPGHMRGKVVLQGTAGEVPDEPGESWELVVSMPGRGDVTVWITPDTEIEGELVEGARVLVKAAWEEDDAGDRVLVAEVVKVLPAPGPRQERVGIHIEGIVLEADETEWLIEDEDGNEVTVQVTDQTRILGLAEGEDPTDREVEVHATRDADGNLIAHLIRVESD